MNKQHSLNNQVALITGAGSGIGKAIAVQLYQAGARLLLTGRDLKKLNAVIDKYQFNPNRVVTITADITQAAGRQHITETCARLKSPLSILINNAGVSDFNLLEDQDAAGIERLLYTNLTAPVLLTQCLLPVLKKSSAGLIVNIGSTFGSIGYPGFSTYCASKFGLRGFTQALRRELANTSIDVCYVAPRATRTPINQDAVNQMNQTLGNQMDDPEIVGQAVLKAILKRNPETYIGWPEKLFVRLNALIPAMVDGSLLKQLPTITQFAKRRTSP
jgi:short-subunit dehydrogenase